LNGTDKSDPNLIDRSGRGPLSYGERQALAMQAKNQRLGAGNLPEDDDAARIRDASSDPGGVKVPRHTVWSRTITIR
jgi:hypothetical protein